MDEARKLWKRNVNSFLETLDVTEEERKRLAAQNGKARTYDGGMFTWPAPSYTRISSEFGNRVHPITKKTHFHSGLDMAAPS